MKKKLEIYTKKLNCQNCGEEIELEIPKGTKVDDFAQTVDCPNCGCKVQCPPNFYIGGTSLSINS